MRNSDVPQRYTTKHDNKRDVSAGAEGPFVSERGEQRGRVEGLRQLAQRLEGAAEVVFQQHFAILHLNSHALYSEKTHELLHTPEGSHASRAALTQQLHDVEDHLSQAANKYIRASNVTALYFLNEKQYSRALQILLAVEGMLQKDAGKWFPFFTPTESVGQNPKGVVPLPVDPRANGSEDIESIFVPFFTKRHEKMRQLALAVVENNIGLYHFKIAEYELAGQRMSRALQLEELLGVETIGVTYFNLAQTQYQLGCLEEAFSSIALAEEAIEKRIYDGQTQRNTLRRMAQHPSTLTATTIPGLERRVLDVYLSWREAVCLLARVLDMHGRWLEESRAYKAAIHRYQQCERWISSVKRQSAEEKAWRGELQKRMQECKRRLRHSGCVPRPPVVSSSAAEPKSIIVTTTLPRRVEIAFGITPSLLEEGEEEDDEKERAATRGVRRGKNKTVYKRPQEGRYPSQETKARYKDVYDMPMEATTLRRKSTNHPESSTNGSHASSHRQRLTPHPPLWDSSTNIMRREERRGESRIEHKTTVATTVSAEPQSLSDNIPMCDTPLAQGAAARRRSTVHRSKNTANTSGCATPIVESSQRREREGILFHRTRASSHITTTTATRAAVTTVPSLARCIHILQAFARARLSCLEQNYRKTTCDRVLVYSSSLSSLSTSTLLSEGLNHRNCTLHIPLSVHHSIKNGGITMTAVSPHAGVCSYGDEVVLAFFEARHSALLTFQKHLERKYAQIMRDVPRPVPPSIVPLQKVEVQKLRKPQEEVITQTTTVDGSLRFVCDDQRRSSLGGEDNVLQERCCFEEKSTHDGSYRNGDNVSEERFQRRYNSLLRMRHHVDVETKSHNHNVTVLNGHLKENPTLASVQATVLHSQSGVSLSPHISEDSSSRNGVTDDFTAPSRRLFIGKDSDGSRSTSNRLPNSTGIPRIIFNRIPNGFTFTDCFNSDFVKRDEACCMKGRLATRNPIYGRAISSSLSSLLTESEITTNTAHATTELIKQRILREGAATIIQHTWRRWRAYRQYEAVRQLICS